MRRIILATNNPNKVSEVKTLLQGLPYKLELSEDGFDVEETGKSFAENARLKAKAWHEHSGGLLALADDSGLIVDALGGRPGVYSKRYGKDDPERIVKLLVELAAVPEVKRTARFVSVIALFSKDVDEVFEGTVEGQIAFKAAGSAGFGYDPIFIPVGFSQTFAELGQEVKNQLSHRSRALAKAIAYLASLEPTVED